MCVLDLLEAAPARISRRGFLEGGLRVGMAAALVEIRDVMLTPGVAEGAETAPASGGPGTSGVNFRWLGTNGWEIRFGNRTVLVDPWLSRTEAGFFSGKPNPDALLTLEAGLIDQHVTRADHILIGHGHFDHIADVPYIAKKTSAMVIGSESHMNMLRAYGIPEDRLVACRGGELMQFDGYAIEVIPSLHALAPNKKVPFPGRLTSVPGVPQTIKDMPDGDTFIYLLTIDRKFQVFLMSSGNFSERAISGLKPDVALVAPFGRSQIHDFTPRLLKALNFPRIVLPTHWDNWERPVTQPPEDGRARLGNDGNLDIFVNELKSASPKSGVVVLKYFESFAP
jgi:L-ascorbate metabolism protein UlaG (beta-lactamase superfamily)